MKMKLLYLVTLIFFSSSTFASILQFRLVPPNNKPDNDLKQYDKFPYTLEGEEGINIELYVEQNVQLTEKEVEKVRAFPLKDGKYRVNLFLKDEGKKIFKELSTKHLGQRLAIIYQEKVVVAPRMDRPLSDGAVMYPETMDKKKAEDFAKSLGVPIEFGEQPPPTPTPSSPEEQMMRDALAVQVEHPGKRGLNESLGIYKEIITKAPKSEWAARAQIAIAQVYFQLGEEAKALSAYEEFVQKYPNESDIIKAQLKVIELVKILEPSRLNVNYEKLIDILEKRIKEKPESLLSGLGVILGQTYYDKGDREKSEKVLNDLLEKLSKEPNNQFHQVQKFDIAQFYAEKKEWQKALNIATQIQFEEERHNQALKNKIETWRREQTIEKQKQ